MQIPFNHEQCASRPFDRLKRGDVDPRVSGSGLRIAIIHSRWNSAIVDALVSGARRSLAEAGVKDENVLIQSVPGSWELPFAAQWYVYQNLVCLKRILENNRKKEKKKNQTCVFLIAIILFPCIEVRRRRFRGARPSLLPDDTPTN